MKILTVIFASLFLFSCTNGRLENTEKTSNNVNGEVNTITESTEPATTVSTAPIEKSDLTNDNVKGKVSSIVESNFPMEEKFGEFQIGIGHNDTIKYDDNGNKVGGSGWVDGWTGNGLLLPIGRQVIYTYKFDEKGKKTEKNTYNLNNQLLYKTIYKYDRNNNQIEENNYYSDGSLLHRTMYKYDDRRNLIEASPNTIYGKTTYKYDSNDKRIEKNDCYSDGSLSNRTTYKYDEKGNRIEENYYNNVFADSFRYPATYKYDDFDKIGNWQKRTLYSNDKPLEVIERDIQYY